MWCMLCSRPGHVAGSCPQRRPAAPKPRARGPWAVRLPSGDWADWDDQSQSVIHSDRPVLIRRRADAARVARLVAGEVVRYHPSPPPVESLGCRSCGELMHRPGSWCEVCGEES